jgi:hypothetical protein
MKVRAQGGVLVQFCFGEGIPCLGVVRKENKPLGLGGGVSETFLCQEREDKLAWQVGRVLVENKGMVRPAGVDALPGLLVGPEGNRSRCSNIVEFGAFARDRQWSGGFTDWGSVLACPGFPGEAFVGYGECVLFVSIE